MRTIRIELSLTDREYDYLKLGKAEQPDPGRVKAWLLQSAMSALRREGEIVMQQFRDREAAEYAARQSVKVVPKAKRMSGTNVSHKGNHTIKDTRPDLATLDYLSEEP